MRTIITVTEYRSMPGRYVVKSDNPDPGRGKARFNQPKDAHGPAAAAAYAMEYAQRVGSNGYCIFAPDDVLKLIPTDMRERA